MFLSVYKAELYKIITSNRFKIAIAGIIIFSFFNIVSQYKCFKDYDSKYKVIKKNYTAEIYENKKRLNELDNAMLPSSSYFKNSAKVIETDEHILIHALEFYNKHEIPKLKKDFSQGLDKSIFDYIYWLLIMLLFCCDIVCSERSKNITKIQFSSYVSRGVLYHSKYLALLTVIVSIFIFNLIFSYFFSGYLMGFSYLSGSMRSIVGYDMAVVERSIRELFILKIIFGFITCASATVLFLFISIVVKDAVASYLICAVLITNVNATFNNSIYYFFKYFFILFYEGCYGYILGDTTYNIKIGLISLFIQTICLYVSGLYIYKRIE